MCIRDSNLGDPATVRPAKHGTFGTTLASFPGERRGVFAQRTTLSGIDVTVGGRDGNLRQIRRCRFENSQHSRGFDVPARGRAGDLRHIRRCRYRNRQHSRGFDVPGREKADTIEESQSRAPVLPCFIGPLGCQVVHFAGGAPFLPRRTAKSRHIREPGRPVCVRHAGPGAPERKNPAQWWSRGAGGGAGKPREHEPGKSTFEIDT